MTCPSRLVPRGDSKGVQIAAAAHVSRSLTKQKLTRAEQLSLRSIRAMQINHEEVDSVLISRTERIAENMMHMRREIGAKSKEWAEVCALMSIVPLASVSPSSFE